MKPLVEIGHVVLDDLQIDAVASLVSHTDIACVKRTRNRNCHALLLEMWWNSGG